MHTYTHTRAVCPRHRRQAAGQHPAHPIRCARAVAERDERGGGGLHAEPARPADPRFAFASCFFAPGEAKVTFGETGFGGENPPLESLPRKVF